MSNKINIVGSTLQGTIAIGANSSASNSGQQEFLSQTGCPALNDLFRTLSSHGITKPDLDALEVAITQDRSSPDILERKLGPNVRTWMSAMFSKAANASWQIELGMAGSILASAINQYYGWP